VLTLTLRELWAYKRRLAGSFVAVLLGTAFLAGTLVLADTLTRSIDAFMQHAYAGTDVMVRNSLSFTDRPGSIRGPIPASVLPRIRQVPGVARAEPVIQGSGQLLDASGKAIKVLGPRTAGNWVPDPALNPYSIVAGRPPSAPGEIVVDRGTAQTGHLRLGQHTYVLTPGRVPVTIVGMAKFGTENSFGGTSFAAFTLADAQRYIAGSADRITSVAVRAAPGVGQRELAARIKPLLPSGVEAITGDDVTQDSIDQVGSFMVFVRAFLLVFAAVALLVGTFGIHNTFAIVVAQRTRQAALLRALGATRGQLIRSVLAEAALVGLIASAAGALAGFGFAAALKELFVRFGFGLKSTSLVFSATPILVAVPVGVLVTLIASLTPALRASRTAPVAALRESAAESPDVSPARRRTGLGLAALSLVLILVGALAELPPVAGVAALLALVAMVVLGPVAVRPAALVAGAPAARLRGAAGELARRNALRSPRRTAGAATALMIGVGVVTLFTVFAASLQTTLADRIGAGFAGDLVVSSGDSTSTGFETRLASDIAALPRVAAAAGTGTGDVRVDGRQRTVRVADPARLAQVVRLRTTSGTLSDDGVAVSTKAGKPVGSTLAIRFSDGSTRSFRVGAVYRPLDAVGDYLLPRSAWPEPQQRDSLVFIRLRPGTSAAAGKAAVTAAARGYGMPSVRTRAEYISDQTSSVRSLLVVVYVMLALAIVIALLGIANTLALAVYERTRELALLRAVGATRRQARSMVRWESVIVALFGTAGGLLLGLLLGWTLVTAAGDTVDVPVVQAIVIVLVGAVAGVLAAIRPARRAARVPLIAGLAP
jgi:putative ABC transport system permease protein